MSRLPFLSTAIFTAVGISMLHSNIDGAIACLTAGVLSFFGGIIFES